MEQPREQVDVLIIGAGLAGIGAACILKAQCPEKSFLLLEARERLGGTWDLFRYPGIRSDSDMFTFGYSFQPWVDTRWLADGPSILRYIQETARQHHIDEKIRYRHRVLAAEFHTAKARWVVEVERTDTGEKLHIECRFLFTCTGYYRYDEGYTPKFAGTEKFRGRIIHPQHWPEDLDYSGKRIVVIGSGATAVTLVPALAERAAHVTMLQRSPTYILPVPTHDAAIAALFRHLPRSRAYSLVRWRNVFVAGASYRLIRRMPKLAKKLLRSVAEAALPKGFDLDKHFKPRYEPWDQRLCFVPDGDLFAALSSGKAEMVTEQIETFTERGLKLASGAELEADIIVTATGLNLLPFGGMKLSVDGSEVKIPESVIYKGMMLSGVPNMAFAMGYANVSWMLKIELVSEYVCRLLQHMDARGYRSCTPRAPEPGAPLEPFFNLQAGYVQRSAGSFPQQGAQVPWRLHQDYRRDVSLFRRAPLEDSAMEFSRA